MKKIFLILLILLSPLSVNAATYYVDNTVATCADYRVVQRDCGSGAEQNYATLAEVNAVLSAGDTAYIRGGTESYQVYNVTALTGAGEGIQPEESGTGYDAMITYATYNNEMVHLQGNTDIEQTYGKGIFINQKNYIKVTGSATNYLKISKCDRNLDINGGNPDAGYARYNEIAYVESTETYLSGYSGGQYSGNIIDDNAEYNWIHHCKFYKHGFSGAGGFAGNLLQVGSDISWADARTDVTRFNIIENCEIYQSGHVVLQIGGSYNIIRNNLIHNEEWMDSGVFLHAFRNILAYTEYDVGRGYHLLEGNRIGRAGRTYTYATSSNSIDWASSETIIRYNSVYDAGSTALELRGKEYAQSYYTRSNDNYIYNNTFYYNDSNEDTATNSKVIAFLYSTYTDHETGTTVRWQAVQGNKVKNNLFYDNYSNRNNKDAYEFSEALGESITTATNCPASATAGCNVISGNYNDGAGENTNPLFTDVTLDSYSSWTLPNLSLQTGSPAIDAASYLTQANGAGEATTTLIVDDAKYFQDGKFGSASDCDPTKWASGVSVAADYIAIGTVTNYVQISEINYATNTITLASAKTWADDASIWLYKKSDGDQVLFGSAPDAGANEFEGTTATVTGTAISAGITETEVVAGGKTIIITLTGGDTWDADVGDDSAETTALIAGMDSNLAEAAGWDAVVKAALTHAVIVRTSDTVVTITLPPYAGYNITQSETITITIPTTCLSSATQVVASPTVTVSVVGQTVAPSGAQISAGAGGAQVSSGAAGWIMK